MLYTKLTIRAMQIAYAAHHGQLDRSGVPYVFHPYHLAEQMPDEDSVCVALLHDVVEDSDWTLEQLAQEFPPQIVEAVRLLTHEDAVPYMEYVKPIRGNALARRVKLADLEHNGDFSRVRSAASEWSEEKIEQHRRKYEAARAYLLAE